ncbi:methyl viologen resistance protein SmvA [Salmonella enterica subsp. enterica serovar Gaminara str. ATCC BAA-711]|nr:methyl viologen resistance protein SmvA [Salmonella enterica subsp. enterica serovar Gaminara str. ATCC BAA-711]
MFRQWLTLVIIVLVYIPVAIDATVLHVAAPTLSMTLGASGNELLWIIDIYSLVMAGMVLPMGALGDRIGFKRLLMLGGTLFGLASLAAAFSHTASWLIATRVLLAIGAAMIVPATLAGIRATFCEEKHRNMALGVWAAVGSGGAAFGPLIGGILLEHFLLGIGFPDQRADCAGRHGLNRPLCSSPGGPSRSTAQSWPCGDADYCHFAVGL